MAIDPEELLWRPIKTIFIPPAPIVDITWGMINEKVMETFYPRLIDQFFPVFTYLRRIKQEMYEATSLIETPVSLVEDPLELTGNLYERQGIIGPNPEDERLSPGSRGIEDYRQSAVHSPTQESVHRGSAKGYRRMV